MSLKCSDKRDVSHSVAHYNCVTFNKQNETEFSVITGMSKDENALTSGSKSVQAVQFLSKLFVLSVPQSQ